MHIPSHFKETDQGTLYHFIKEYPLGTLITSVADIIDADHIPFYLNEDDACETTLQSHIARVNSLWQKCSDGQDVLLIFHGSNTYISPNFYPSKKEAGKAVPTWNYSTVHVKGKIYFKHESAWILPLLEKLSDLHESKSQDVPWSVADAPEAFTQKLLRAVVGLEVKIDSMVGNFKLSQNKTMDDYNGVLEGLKKSNQSNDFAVYKQMQKFHL